MSTSFLGIESLGLLLVYDYPNWGKNYAPYPKDWKVSDETFDLIKQTLRQGLATEAQL